MAKRELSSTLKNLKFMQRAAQKDEKEKKEEEVLPAGDFPSCSAARKCVVIMEGDPHPGQKSGRMSFLSFNPSIDKLNEEVTGQGKNEYTAASSATKNETSSSREHGSSTATDNMETTHSAANGDLKRKQAEVATEPQLPNKKNNKGNHGSARTHSRHPQKHDKLDWNLLRPPKPHNKSKR
ncbi:uncharacterized protein LOC127261405 [Andrographis paniculata]|uniref:uncharacterized protein LOC127261405 n=1 Tax=Andrographis paniculata TaxID=175694 RepID=UPI0021E984AA|nr:uncharacterized protein LOC127261405 [Andrographis paniculata]